MTTFGKAQARGIKGRGRERERRRRSFHLSSSSLPLKPELLPVVSSIQTHQTHVEEKRTRTKGSTSSSDGRNSNRHVQERVFHFHRRNFEALIAFLLGQR